MGWVYILVVFGAVLNTYQTSRHNPFSPRLVPTDSHWFVRLSVSVA